MHSPRSLALSLALVLLPVAAQDDAQRASSEAAQREAWAHHQAHRYAQAVEGYRAAIARWPENHRALNNLAWLLLTAEDPSARSPQDALPLAERAVALAPDDAGILDTLATAHDALGHPLEAARLELRALRLAPEPATFAPSLRDFARRALTTSPDPGTRPELNQS